MAQFRSDYLAGSFVEVDEVLDRSGDAFVRIYRSSDHEESTWLRGDALRGLRDHLNMLLGDEGVKTTTSWEAELA